MIKVPDIAKLLIAASTLFSAPLSATAAEPAACKTVRFSDVGWSDVTATTAIATVILQALGYTPKVNQLSVEVSFKSLQTKNIDVFLGDWQPSMSKDIAPYLADKSVEVLRVNMEGAKYSLAVPDYTYENGLHDYSDIIKYKDSLKRKIFGLEPGNDGNSHVLDFIKSGQFGLKDFQLVESSEQGMLSEVARAIKKHEDVVFLAWSPHQMNSRFKIGYLSGGDDSFGPNYGAATVSTVVRAGYAAQCPNVAAFLNNLHFTPELEAKPMAYIGDDKLDPQVAAKKFLKENPDVLTGWLKGVTTFDGQSANAAIAAQLGAAP